MALRVLSLPMANVIELYKNYACKRSLPQYQYVVLLSCLCDFLYYNYMRAIIQWLHGITTCMTSNHIEIRKCNHVVFVLSLWSVCM